MDAKEFAAFIDRGIANNPIEADILTRTVEALAAAGTPVTSVYDTDEDVPVTDLRSIQEQVFNLDEAYLRTANGSWVRFIMGNEEDVICDYTVDLEAALQPVNDYIEARYW